MRRGDHLAALSTFPQWCAFNDAQLRDIVLTSESGKGNYFKATRDLSNDEDNAEPPVLLTVPKDLVLSAEALQQYAKVDQNFRDIYDAVGHPSHRIDTLLFLFIQYIYSSPDFPGHKGPASPWTWYFDVLPTDVPVPTMWPGRYRHYLLRGTSLEAAVLAKMSALEEEFDDVCFRVADNPFWEDLFGSDTIQPEVWIFLDALYRSRSLELPKSGESMVPILDMVNHSADANSYFDETDDGEVRLLLRKGHSVGPSTPGCTDEITIDYGHGKSAAEMLFSYGFIEPGYTAKSLTLPLKSMDDDPLSKAKLMIYGGTPTLKIEENADGVPTWKAPLIYLMCLNEDDGIAFRVLQTVDGGRELKLFWKEEDVSDRTTEFEDLIRGHELEPIFHLRAITVVMSRLNEQIESLNNVDHAIHEEAEANPNFSHTYESVMQLRRAELALLERMSSVLEEQRGGLLEDDRVQAYLGSMEETPNEEAAAQSTNDEEDFS
ncbi:hypothetical protein BJ166DRAFT_220526 [Pestalotiopsis sp. NC0098]|nr:hypothetical protein BJ166DRAFT_220526 [Pestalotiopsis sp. NC0098]